MTGLELPDAAFLLLPLLALAAGVELYLTLLVLSVASAVGWLADPPWILSSAGSTAAVTTAILYGLELASETRAVSALLWHTVQTVARPLAGILLGAALLSSRGAALGALGGLVGGGLTWLAHAVKRGADFRRWLSGGERAAPLLISACEDVVVLGLLILSLERPVVGGALGIAGTVALLAVNRPPLAAARLGFRLAWDRTWSFLWGRGWQRGERLPAAVRKTWKRGGRNDEAGLRGIRAGALDLPGRSGLVSGWLLAAGRGISFAETGPGGGRVVELDPPLRVAVEEGVLWDRMRLTGEGDRPTTIILSKRGAPARAVAAELGDGVGAGR